jgi:hypothetical protein
MTNTIGTIPEFTTDDGTPEGVKENEEIVVDSPTTEEPTTEETTTDEVVATETTDDDRVEGDEIAALRREREALLGDIKGLRTERRELRAKPVEEPLFVDQKDDLSDIDTEQLGTLRRVLKAEGYVKSTELEGRFTKEAQEEVRDEFLDSHPEYKPENDKDDLNWKRLTSELGLYAQPKDRKTLKMILKKAHDAVSETSRTSTEDIDGKKRVIARAGAGAGRGGKTVTTIEGGKIPAHLREHMKGFDDEDFE